MYLSKADGAARGEGEGVSREKAATLAAVRGWGAGLGLWAVKGPDAAADLATETGAGEGEGEALGMRRVVGPMFEARPIEEEAGNWGGGVAGAGVGVFDASRAAFLSFQALNISVPAVQNVRC